jgi:hypothetical protein
MVGGRTLKLGSNTLMRAAIAAAVALCLASCGDSSAKCDLPDNFSCIEHSGSKDEISAWKSACSDNHGVSGSGSCSDEDLIGCCTYTFGGTFHECFYEGFEADPEAYCGTYDDGVWEPATP